MGNLALRSLGKEVVIYTQQRVALRRSALGSSHGAMTFRDEANPQCLSKEGAENKYLFFALLHPTDLLPEPPTDKSNGNPEGKGAH